MSRQGPWARVLLLVGLCGGACTGEAPEPAVPKPLVVTLRGQTRAFLGGAWVAARRVTATQPVAGGGWRVEVDLVADYGRSPVRNGLEATHRAVILPLKGIKLLSGGQTWPADIPDPPADPPAGGIAFPTDIVYLAAEAPRRAVARVSFQVDTPLLGDDMFLRVETYEGTGELRIRGHWRASDGSPQVAVQLVGLDGRPVPSPLELVLGDRRVRRDASFLPWRVPAGPGTWTVAGVGTDAAPVTVTLTADGPDEVVVSVPDVDPEHAFDADVAGAFGPVDGDPRSDVQRIADGLAEADPLRTQPADVLAWLDAHVDVASTLSYQRAPGSVIRRGVGSPFERALVARELVASWGRQARVACGDLELDDAKATYRHGTVVETRLTAGADLLAAFPSVTPAHAALLPQVKAGLDAWPDRPAGHRARFGLVPEWCQVESRALGLPEDAPWEPLDLRAPELRQGEPPAMWRSVEQVGDEMWSVFVRVGAVHTGASGAVDLVARHVNAAVLADVPLLIDLYPSPRVGSLRGQSQVVYDDALAGEVGGDVPYEGLQSVFLELVYNDPDRIDSSSRTWTLWERGDDDVDLRAMRLFLAGDSGVVSLEQVRARLARALTVVHPAPDAVALRARSDLASAIRAQLSGGLLTAEPALSLQTLTALSDGTTAWGMQSLPAVGPASVGAPPADALARLAAADAVARATVLGVSPPAAPSRWVLQREQEGEVPNVSRWLGAMIVRTIDQIGYGTEPGGSLWAYDRSGGGLAWYVRDAVPVRVPPTLAASEPPSTEWPMAFWDRTIRCEEALRWATIRGVAAPASCSVAAPTTP